MRLNLYPGDTQNLTLVTSFLALTTFSLLAQDAAKAPAKNFSKAVADIEIVVKNLEKSAKLYTAILHLNFP
jgi:hypothetical protein